MFLAFLTLIDVSARFALTLQIALCTQTLKNNETISLLRGEGRR